MPFPASFVKLAGSDGRDTWGVRLPPSNGDQPKAGDVVVIVTRAGERKSVTLAEPKGTNRYGDSLWTLAPQAKPAQAEMAVGNLGGVLALFAKAKQHLKFPAIVLDVPEANVVVRLTVAGPKAKVPGSVTVCENDRNTTNDYGDPSREWLGRVTVDGGFQPSRATNGRAPAIAKRLGELAANPAKVASEYGRLTGACCFCSRPLKDERSTAVGYGQTCAAHFGLPWGKGDFLAEEVAAS